MIALLLLDDGSWMRGNPETNAQPEEPDRRGVRMLYVTRWDEKAGLRRDAVRSQVIDVL